MVLVRLAPHGQRHDRLPLVSVARRDWHYRANVAARVAAALIGGYAIPSLFAYASARLLPMPRLDAIIPGTLLAFAIMPAIVVWAFLARSAVHAWAGMTVVAAALAAAGWLAA